MKPSMGREDEGSMEVKYVPWYPSSSASERPELGSSAPGEVAGAEDLMLDPVVYPGRSGRWYIYLVSASPAYRSHITEVLTTYIASS